MPASNKIELASSQDLHLLREQHYNASISFVNQIHPTLRIIRVTSDNGPLKFEPGQFTTLGLLTGEACVASCHTEDPHSDPTKLIRRAYSMSHPMVDGNGNLFLGEDVDFLEFYVVLVDKEAVPEHPPTLTPRLFNLEDGEKLFLGKVSGHYCLDSEEVSQKKHLIFCATGTGEAPHNAMVWKLLLEGFEARLTVVTSVRNQTDLGYLHAYETLQEKFPNLTYIALITRDPENPKRYIQDIIENGELEKKLGEKLSPEKHSFYLCGNPLMIGAPKVDPKTGDKTFPSGRTGVIKVLEKRGFKYDLGGKVAGSIHSEKYW